MAEEADPTLALMVRRRGKGPTQAEKLLGTNKEREELFRMRIQVKTGLEDCIIDPGCEKNLMSDELVTRLGLETTPHEHPYMLEWCDSKGEMEVTKQCKIKFAVTAKFIDEVACEVVPLSICYVILGNPYLWDRDAVYYRRAQKYTLVKDGKEYMLVGYRKEETSTPIGGTVKVRKAIMHLTSRRRAQSNDEERSMEDARRQSDARCTGKVQGRRKCNMAHAKHVGARPSTR
jgi:hypothetical protein